MNDIPQCKGDALLNYRLARRGYILLARRYRKLVAMKRQTAAVKREIGLTKDDMRVQRHKAVLCRQLWLLHLDLLKVQGDTAL